MQNSIQVNIEETDFNEDHEKQLNTVVERIHQIVPENSKVEGRIIRIAGNYEGRIKIRTRIGSFIAKAKAKNIFALISKLQVKVLRQIVNWREKRASKKRYLRRKHLLVQIPNKEPT